MLTTILILLILSFLAICFTIYISGNIGNRILDENERLIRENENLRIINNDIIRQIQEFSDFYRKNEEFNKLMETVNLPIIPIFIKHFQDLYSIINNIIRSEEDNE